MTSEPITISKRALLLMAAEIKFPAGLPESRIGGITDPWALPN